MEDDQRYISAEDGQGSVGKETYPAEFVCASLGTITSRVVVEEEREHLRESVGRVEGFEDRLKQGGIGAVEDSNMAGRRREGVEAGGTWRGWARCRGGGLGGDGPQGDGEGRQRDGRGVGGQGGQTRVGRRSGGSEIFQLELAAGAGIDDGWGDRKWSAASPIAHTQTKQTFVGPYLFGLAGCEGPCQVGKSSVCMPEQVGQVGLPAFLASLGSEG